MSAMDRIKNLPDWPARISAPVAVAYMGISTNALTTRFSRFSVTEGSNVLWARAQLDSLIASQFGFEIGQPALLEANAQKLPCQVEQE